jgi:Quinohemoprotein amine dehydrogenase A, alpha subunit, haem binding
MSAIRIHAVFAAIVFGIAAGGLAAAASPNDVLPEAPGKEIVVRACTSCHQAPQIVAKRHTPEEWDELVGKMIARGAAVDDAEEDVVINYLTKYFGPGESAAPIAPASPDPAPAQ